MCSLSKSINTIIKKLLLSRRGCDQGVDGSCWWLGGGVGGGVMGGVRGGVRGGQQSLAGTGNTTQPTFAVAKESLRLDTFLALPSYPSTL